MTRRGVGAVGGWTPLVVAAGAFALLMAVAGRYGWHRDELYFFEAGRHLSWAYVDFPPVVAGLARLSRELFGASLVGLRLWPALAVGATVLLAAATAVRLGGSRRAAGLAALATGLCPAVLGAGHLLSAATIELLLWAAITFVVVGLLDGDDERRWLLLGGLVGIAFLAKHSVVFLVAALLVGLVTTGRARVLRSRWLWGGAVIALALAAPNVWWHATHDWPVLEMLESLSDESEAVDAFVFVPAQIGMTFLATVVWLPGLVWLLRSPQSAAWRSVGVAYLVLVVVLSISGAKPYYLLGMYPVLMAAGGVWWGRRGRTAIPVTAVAVGSLGALMALPILSPDRAAEFPSEDLELEFGAQLGWEELADHVAVAYGQLTADGDRAVVVTSNYGSAGAVDLYGPARGVPGGWSPMNHEWLWGPPPEADDAVIVGFERDQVEEWFARCSLEWRFVAPHGVAAEENGGPVWACEGLRTPWADLWPDLRRYRA
ncbi:MAG TPA: glycosyltransferase family 39 protein [Acidimicrobiia bacterium]|nr:glycosyltransferase family 39 protein [Acidimicrobiia bacterium]